MPKILTPYEAYKNKYQSIKSAMKLKTQTITDIYSEEEFNAIYERAQKALPDYTKDRVIQLIVSRQKKYIELF